MAVETLTVARDLDIQRYDDFKSSCFSVILSFDNL